MEDFVCPNPCRKENRHIKIDTIEFLLENDSDLYGKMIEM